jgi:diaminopimelate epimerase
MTAFVFDKLEGLGNDFVLVSAGTDAEWNASRVARVCDRRFGVGADGVILVLPPLAGGVARMHVMNADGSVPEMCGNGLRCVVLLLAGRAGLGSGELIVETDAGARLCRFEVQDGVGEVDVDMGVVRLVGERALAIAGVPLDLTLVDAGNPHAVAYRAEPEQDLPAVGLALATHESFPHGTNVELVRWKDGAIEVAVWERGVGRTLACGTGACAVAAVACARDEAPSQTPIRIKLPGGDLLVTHDVATGGTRMKGPARRVFSGEWVAR